MKKNQQRRWPEVAWRMKRILDICSMPLENTAAAQVQLLSWSDSDIGWLVQAKFPELDSTTLKNQALELTGGGSIFEGAPLLR
mmetsp:Transcript_58955/g.133471  ORF Transcript_58955/g.133471 Transcript_58955/m.133471 type:complete len:83 (-) Transcript_58955:435-683(-)